MARKRQVIENPPPADSSSEEEQESSQENDAVQDDSEHEHEHEHEEEENDAVAEEEEEEEDDEDEDEEEEESPVKKSTDSDLDSDSDGTQPSPTASGFTIKPIISKPLDDVTKPKKPVSKSGSKRPAETDPVEPESKNKKKKKSSNDNSNSNNEEAKKVSGGTQRVWSEDDEIALLKGMSENRTLKGSDPADMGVFYEYIKKSMHFDLSKTQLVDKIRRLKKKYQNNVQKGQDPVFAKPHEERAFLLSKKIWGGEVTNGNVNNNNNVVVVGDAAGNSKKKVKQISTTSASGGPGGGGGNSKVVGSVTLALPSGKNSVFNHDVKLDGEKNGELKSDDSGDFWSSFPCLNGSFEIGKVLALPEFGKSFLKGRMSLIGSDKAGELEEKWRNLQEEELKLYLKRVELVKQQGELALETIRASRS